jgi:hypothetical protein
VDDDVTINGLKFNVKALFPQLSELDLSNMVLLYKDNDNDTITMSTDEELRVALAELAPGASLRVWVKLSAPVPVIQHEGPPADHQSMEDDLMGSLFQSFFPFHHGPLVFDHTPSWLQRQRSLKLHEEKVRQQRLYEEKMRKAREEQLEALREKALKEREEMRKRAMDERKKSVELQRRASQEGNPLVPQFPPGWQVQTFGAWDPVLEEGPGFSQQSWGPYGYVAYYDPSSATPGEDDTAATTTAADDSTNIADEETQESETSEVVIEPIKMD